MPVDKSKNLYEAIEIASQNKLNVCVCGSLYLAGEFLKNNQTIVIIHHASINLINAYLHIRSAVSYKVSKSVKLAGKQIGSESHSVNNENLSKDAMATLLRVAVYRRSISIQA